jgi:Cu/Ag efflux pump CusA
MIPIAPTVFWGPMAFAIMGGLLVATILTLIFLPTLYVIWFKGSEGPSEPLLETVNPARQAASGAHSDR